MYKKIFLFFIILLGFSAIVTTPSFAKGENMCHQYSVPVTLSSNDPTTYHIAGWLCIPKQKTDTVQLLVSGATYSHIYWDFPYNPNQYSFVQYMTDKKYATFAIDRIGVGQSDHPTPENITVQVSAYTIHQIINQLRSGQIGGKSFDKITIVGHSLGSVDSIVEAATYHDVDAVVLTGSLHNISPDALNLLSTAFYPAISDPKFATSGLQPGYLTTVPGIRGSAFYYAPNADATVIATDEIMKDVVADGEVSSAGPVVLSTLSQQINVPVLLVVGQKDTLECGGAVTCDSTQNVLTYESAYYSPSAHLQVKLIPNTGHDLNLHYSAKDTFEIINHWIHKNI